MVARQCNKLGLELIAAVMLLLTPIQAVAADDVYTVIIKKQEQKKSTRWSLQDWLETRDRMRLMDLWLAIHSPSPYEFYLGGDYNFSDSNSQGRFRTGRAYMAAYASIFGLEFQKSFSPRNEMLGIFHLRVFGFHAQATNLTLEGGIRDQSEPYTNRNGFAGASMSIYIGRFFGVEGVYWHHFQGIPNDSGLSLTGEQYSGGAFIDFKFLRVYGDYYSKPATVNLGGTTSEIQETGIATGTRLYF